MNCTNHSYIVLKSCNLSHGGKKSSLDEKLSTKSILFTALKWACHAFSFMTLFTRSSIVKAWPGKSKFSVTLYVCEHTRVSRCEELVKMRLITSGQSAKSSQALFYITDWRLLKRKLWCRNIWEQYLYLFFLHQSVFQTVSQQTCYVDPLYNPRLSLTLCKHCAAW